MTPDGGRTGGFTLLEILVALTIVAIALGAAISGTGRHVDNTDHLRAKTMAHWVAQNRLAEVRVTEPWPATGTTSGTAEMARREWRWSLDVTDTPDAYVRALTVTVAAAETPDAVLARAVGYTGPGPVQIP